MSTKKDRFLFKDKNFMKLALNLARARKGFTGDNPSVGCVIVKKGKIISIGQTGFGGRPHAEHNAIENSFENLQDSKMYVTLEPCNHYGKTPPCTNKIIKSGIKKVYYSVDDIDKKVKGKSLKILTKKNIIVKKGLLKKEGKKLYKSYTINRNNKLPYVTAKIAVSKNRLIYSKSKKRITNKITDKLTHFLRYKNDAIMVSYKTINTDNPKLNCRLRGYEKFSPKRIILDKNLDIKLKTNIIMSAKKDNTIIFYGKAKDTKIKNLKKKKIILIKSSINRRGLFDLKTIFKRLFKLKIKTLLIEGGDQITKNILNRGLFNEFYLFQSSKKINIKDSHVSFTSLDILGKKYNKYLKSRFKIADDNIRIYER